MFERDSYTSQETAKAIVDIDNTSCEIDVSRVVMELKQTVKLKDGHDTYERSETITTKTFEGAKAKSNMEKNFVELDLSKASQKAYKSSKSGKKELSGDEQLLAGYLQPTTKGKCVKIEYSLQVK